MGLFSGPRRGGPAGAQERNALFGISGPGDLIPPRPFIKPNFPYVTNDTALRHSAVWACLRLRAGLISTLPVDCFTRVNGIQVQQPKPPVLLAPGGPEVDWPEWCYSTQFDLDRTGNTVGLITAVDGFGLPARIELQDINSTTIRTKEGKITKFKIGNTLYDPEQVWHEKQYTVPGLPIGLSPVAYARWTLAEYLTVLEFATNWFGAGVVPKAQLKNKAKTLNTVEIANAKEAWRAALAADEPLVTGSDWEYTFIQAQQASADWLDAKKFSITDVCRFFDVPAEVIDSTATGQSRAYQYANIGQKNLELLIIHLGPAIIRRETRLSNKLLPQRRFLKLNGDALLRLDPLSRAQVIAQQIASRVLAPSEGRELENRPPFTAAQLAEFDYFWPPPGTPQGAPSAGSNPDGSVVPLPEGDLVPATLSDVIGGGALPALRTMRRIEAIPASERAALLNGKAH